MNEEKNEFAVIKVDDALGIGKYSKPFEKFIEVASKGLGTLYRPRSIRKEADAEAYATRAKAEAASDEILLISKTGAECKVIQADAELEIIERAKNRLINHEIQKQINLEAIVEKAEKYLPEQVSDDPVDDDWRTRFFNVTKDVSGEEMQEIWAKLLAGEVAKPGSFSLRSIETLRNMTNKEAKLFEIACNLSFSDGRIIKTVNKTDFKEFGLIYDDILVLRSAGLVHSSDSLSMLIRDCDTLSDKTVTIKLNNSVSVYIEHPTNKEFTFDTINLTPSGKELMKLVEPNPNYEYLIALTAAYESHGYIWKKVDIPLDNLKEGVNFKIILDNLVDF